MNCNSASAVDYVCFISLLHVLLHSYFNCCPLCFANKKLLRLKKNLNFSLFSKYILDSKFLTLFLYDVDNIIL